jgi:hypothetical protein
MRALGQLNMKSAKNNLETPAECEQFKNCLKNNLYNIYRTFNNDVHHYIDSIIIVRDGYSWRKDVSAVRPYYITDPEFPVGYKEHRKAVRDDSTINYDNFYELHNSLMDELKDANIDGVHVIGHNKLEGDDIICMLSDMFKLDDTREFVCFCTDSDLSQTVRDNFSLLRNIRSKEAPNGEMVVSATNYNKVCESTAIRIGDDAFLNPPEPINPMYFVTIGDSRGEQKTTRPIVASQPFIDILVKAISGEPGDNLFPLIKWSINNRQYRVTEKMIGKALMKLNLSPSSEITNLIAYNTLKNPDRLKLLVIELIRSTPCSLDIKILGELLKHLQHNLSLIILSPKSIPETYRLQIQDTLNNINFDSCIDDILLHEVLLTGTERNDVTSIDDIFLDSINLDLLNDAGITIIDNS